MREMKSKRVKKFISSTQSFFFFFLFWVISLKFNLKSKNFFQKWGVIYRDFYFTNIWNLSLCLAIPYNFRDVHIHIQDIQLDFIYSWVTVEM